MFIGGQRVRLTQKAATARMKFRRHRVRANQIKKTHCNVNWFSRIGTVRTCKGANPLVSGSTNILVIWDGTKSPESIPVQGLEVFAVN